MLEPKLIQILEELFAIGGNHDIAKTALIRQKLTDFMVDNNLFLKDQDKNFIMVKDTIRFIDAHTNLATTTDRDKASVCLKPFFRRLYIILPEDWNYYELKFLINSLHLVEDIKQALRLGYKSLTIVSKFKDLDNSGALESSIICNVCNRILYAKYFDNHVHDKIDLAQEFNKWFEEFERLAKKSSKIELDFLVTKIRKALFFRDRQLVGELLNELKTRYDEKVFDTINNAVIMYYTKFDSIKSNSIFDSRTIEGGEC